MTDTNPLLDKARGGARLSDQEALALADCQDTRQLAAIAAGWRDQGFGNLATYSRKVFIPLTHLCRDVCHYCTFAQVPRRAPAPYMALDQVLEVARHGASMGCKEALFTLGEKPELRYKAARQWLAEAGFASTLDYLHQAAAAVLKETGLLPHFNAGTMTPAELRAARPLSPSMGIMLESASARLCGKGMPHYGSPDKVPAVRLQTLDDAGAAKIPFTTGILIGIGETRRERIESLLAICALHQRHGHIQEVIIQNFRAKPETKMAQAPEPDLNELLWTIALARLIFGPAMSIQAPPNLSPGVLAQIVAAGINDWGGVSPVTPDFVNPEAPWPHLDELAAATAQAGKELHERLTIYPAYAQDCATWVAPELHEAVLNLVDADGFPRTDPWAPGEQIDPPQAILAQLPQPLPPSQAGRPNGAAKTPERASPGLAAILAKATRGEELGEAEVVRLFRARGPDFAAVAQAANSLREAVNGDEVSFVVNRNINYTNICYFKCQFCAFSKGKLAENLRGRPYDLSHEEIQRRTRRPGRGAARRCACRAASIRSTPATPTSPYCRR